MKNRHYLSSLHQRFVMTEECVDNFVLSLDAIIRVGGAISNDECDDAEQINAALASA